MTTYYKKENDQYVAVSEYDHDFMESIPPGFHLIECRPGVKHVTYAIDPAIAPMIAAGTFCINQISDHIRKSTELKPHTPARVLDEEVHRRWIEYLDQLPDEARFLVTHGSARQAAQAGVEALSKKAEEFLKNPSVKKAYEHFILMCKLANEQETNK